MMAKMPSNQLRVFGDRTKFRRKLRDRIRAGMHLLDECEGGRLRLTPATDTGLQAELENFSIVETLAGRTDRWHRENRALVATRDSSAHQEHRRDPSASRQCPTAGESRRRSGGRLASPDRNCE
jgi:hypothetical protein